VVVNYDGLDDTRRCVTSLLAGAYRRHLIVVVDNGSRSGDAARLSDEFGDRIHVIAAGKNLGYGGGANLGLEWATTREATYGWVLNNDTTVDEACIGRLVDAMESNAGYGILSPQISAAIGPEAPSGIWFAGGRVLLRRAETRHSVTPAEGSGVVETEYVTGCAMFMRCAALADTGLFWERLFLFWEDVDLSLRMRRAGWRLGVLPDARIRHEIHGTIASRTLEYYHFRNALVVVRTYGSRATAASALLFLAGGVARRWARALLRRKPAPSGATRGFLVGIWYAVRWPASREPRTQSGYSR
jgi:GT2 family glycosyltransferase